MVRGALATVLVTLTLSTTASGQSAGGEAFASYALDFCAAVVDGGDIAAARAAASPDARFAGPRPAGDDAKLVGRDLKADRDTPIVILGPPEGSRRVLMAFARADSSRCMTFAGEGEGSLDALYRRLSGETSGWQAELESSGVRVYERTTADGEGGVILFVVPERGSEVARVVVERGDKPTTVLTQAQRAAWALHVVTQCAAAIHNGQDPAPDSFKPYFKPSAKQTAGSTSLDEEDGQPGGVMFLKKGGKDTCFLTIGSGGVLDLEHALQDALTGLGAERQADGHYRLKKPQGAKGRDAMFEVTRMPLLMVRAYRR